MPPGDRVLVQERLGDRVEGPGADDLVALGADVGGEELAVARGIETPARADLGGERAREPGVEDVGLADEPVRPTPLLGREPRRHVDRRVDGQRVRGGDDRPLVVGAARAVERVPHRDRHAEVALAAHAPVGVQVLRPVAEPQPHEVGVPADLVALGEELILLVEQAHEPLAARDELERPLALLVELDAVLDRPRLAAKRSRRAQLLDDDPPRLRERPPGEPAIDGVGGLGPQALPAPRAEDDLRIDPAVTAHHLPQRQPLGPPPQDVGGVAERAHHENAGPLLGIDQRAREDGHRHVEERGERPPAEEVAMARVVGVRGDPDARREQLGPRRGDHELAAPFDRERHVVKGAAHGAVLHLGLRHGGLEVDVPHRGRLDRVDVALGPEVEERELGHVAAAGVDGRVLLVPVDRKPEATPELLERRLVPAGEVEAELDEAVARDGPRRLAALGLGRGTQVARVRRRGLAAHVVVRLHPPLGRQPVVVPAHRVEDAAAAHALVAGEHVGVRVAEHVPHVQRSRHGGRRRVDDERLRARARGIPAMDAEALPLRPPPRLGRGRVEVLGERSGIDHAGSLR